MGEKNEKDKHRGVVEEHDDGGVAVAGGGDDEGLQPDEELLWGDAEAQVERPQGAGVGVAVREHPGHLTDSDVEGEEFVEQTERRGRRARRRRGCRDVGRQVAHAALDLGDDVRPAGVLAADAWNRTGQKRGEGACVDVSKCLSKKTKGQKKGSQTRGL